MMASNASFVVAILASPAVGQMPNCQMVVRRWSPLAWTQPFQSSSSVRCRLAGIMLAQERVDTGEQVVVVADPDMPA
jgi:hypothetical protein